MWQHQPGCPGEVVGGDLGASLPSCQGAGRPYHHDVGSVAVDVGVEAGARHRHEGLVVNDHLIDEVTGPCDSFAHLVAGLLPRACESCRIVLEGQPSPDDLDALVARLSDEDGARSTATSDRGPWAGAAIHAAREEQVSALREARDELKKLRKKA